MAELYWGTTGAFVEEATQNRIAETLREAEPSEVPDCVGVMYGGRLRDRLHPSAQAGQYCGLKRGIDAPPFMALVKNTHRVLLSRGIKGCYVTFTDEKTRDFVESRIGHLTLELAAERGRLYDEPEAP